MTQEAVDRTILYKFRSLASAQDEEFARDIILNHRLYAASPKSFNDPFDCDTPVSFEATRDQKINRAIERIRLENPSICDQEAQQLALSRCEFAETSGRDRNRVWISDELGVVCLTAVVNNQLLWAHYASGHTGISIRFRATDHRHVDFLGQALAVTYQKERQAINFYLDNLQDQTRKRLLTKSLDWAYENEQRILVINRNHQAFFTFHPSTVDAIYLGCRIDERRRRLVREWLSIRKGAPTPRLFQAHASKNNYELAFEEIWAPITV